MAILDLKSRLSARIAVHADNAKKRRKWSHSPAHDLADEISRAFGEPKRFVMYLGAIQRLGPDRARQIFSDIMQSECDSPGKLFFWKFRDIVKNDPKPQRRPRVKKPVKPKQLPLI